MAKTVDNFSTIEDFRTTYNELAFDVGEKDGLRDGLKLGTNGTLVDALNILEDKKFFLQEYTYIATTNQTTFTGNDNFSVKLLFKKDKIQVFKNERHLVEDIDYIVANPDGQGNHESIVLQGTYASGQSNAMAANDRLTIYSYTGAFIGTQIAGTASSFFQKSAENTIYNTNANGVILNGDNSSATTTLETGFTLQLAGKTFAEDDIISSVAGKKVQFPTITDGTASLSSGSLTSAVNGTFSGQVQAEHLVSTDDLAVADGASFGGDIAVLGNAALFGSANQIGNSSSDSLEIQGDLVMTSAVITSNFLPKVNNSVTLGSSSKKWSNVHSTTFTGNLTGDVTGDVKSSGGQTIIDNGTNGTNATARLSTITNDGSTTVLNVASGLLTGTVSSIANHDTDVLSEGTSNLYFTNTRADGRIAAADINDLSNVNTTGKNTNSVLKYNGSNWVVEDINEFVADTVGAMISANTESGLSVTYDDADNTLDLVLDNSDFTLSGAVTGSFTQTAKGNVSISTTMNSAISSLSDVGSTSGASAGQILVFDGSGNLQVADNSTGTDSISEQTNKYFTDGRVNSVVQAGLGLAKVFNDGSNNLDGTTTLSVNTSNGVKIDGDDVELDYSVITDSDLSGGLPSGSGKSVGHLYFLV